LLAYGRSDTSFQDCVFRSEGFQSLPNKMKAALLYYTGIENIVFDRQAEIGKTRVAQAKDLYPKAAKLHLVHELSRTSPWLLGLGIRWWKTARSVAQGWQQTAPREFVAGATRDSKA
jgi:hypothetical protein